MHLTIEKNIYRVHTDSYSTWTVEYELGKDFMISNEIMIFTSTPTGCDWVRLTGKTPLETRLKAYKAFKKIDRIF